MMDGSEFRDRLMPGENLLWYGQPARGLLFTSQDIFFVPFSLLWGGFALFWETGVLRSNAGFFFALWGIPFVLIGLYLIVGRFFADAFLRAMTWYGLTDQRILIQRNGPFAAFTALPINRLPSVMLTERPDGRGTILFDQPQPAWGNRGFRNWMPSLGPPQFLAIDGARAVYDKIQQLAAAKKTA